MAIVAPVAPVVVISWSVIGDDDLLTVVVVFSTTSLPEVKLGGLTLIAMDRAVLVPHTLEAVTVRVPAVAEFEKSMVMLFPLPVIAAPVPL